MPDQPDAPNAQPATRPAAPARARLMHQALSVLRTLWVLIPVLLLQSSLAQAQGTEPPPGIRSGVAQSTGIKVTMPNGFATVQHTDMSLQSVGSAVNWTRYWAGREWKSNPHWESLSVNWSNLIRGRPIALSSQESSNPDRKAV